MIDWIPVGIGNSKLAEEAICSCFGTLFQGGGRKWAQHVNPDMMAVFLGPIFY